MNITLISPITLDPDTTQARLQCTEKFITETKLIPNLPWFCGWLTISFTLVFLKSGIIYGGYVGYVWGHALSNIEHMLGTMSSCLCHARYQNLINANFRGHQKIIQTHFLHLMQLGNQTPRKRHLCFNNQRKNMQIRTI